MKVTPLIASRFYSDGGSMFGLVPYPIWSKLITPNERNAIPQHAHSLLIELDNGRKGLFDTGCGDPDRFTDKERSLHGMDRTWPLMDQLTQRGVCPESIDFVVLTHAHWDHAGGIGRMVDGDPVFTFPNAQVYLHEQEWTDATSGDPLLYKSYPADVIEPLRHLPSTQRRLVRENITEIFPGVRMMRSSGHTRGHCVLVLEHSNLELNHPQSEAFAPLRQLWFTGDVCPTQHHLRMVFQTAYDTYPLDTRRWKRTWLPRAATEQIALFFDHDPHAIAARIQVDQRREFVVTETLPAES